MRQKSSYVWLGCGLAWQEAVCCHAYMVVPCDQICSIIMLAYLCPDPPPPNIAGLNITGVKMKVPAGVLCGQQDTTAGFFYIL